MNKTLLEFLEDASPRELLEAYFDARTEKKGSISLLPEKLVSLCISNIEEAVDKLPTYGKDNKIFTRKKYLESKKKLKNSGFKL